MLFWRALAEVGTSVTLFRIWTQIADSISYDHTAISIYQTLRTGRMWHKVNFKQSLTDLSSEFSFS